MSTLTGGGGYGINAKRNFHRLLEILEIDVDRLEPIIHPTQFENIIIPDESFFLGDGQRKFTAEYREMIDHVRNFALKNQQPTASKKIYYFYGTAQVGEKRIAQYLQSKGYEIVQPERLTVDDQLNLLINAESFASTIGSCSHNSIFLRDGVEVILIPRAAERFTGYQQTLDTLHPLNVTYVDSSLSVFLSPSDSFHGPYCFIISGQLKKFFGDEFSGYSDDDLKIFLLYVRNSMSRGFEQNERALRYYAPMYRGFYEQLKQRGDLLKAFGVNLS